MRSKQTHDEADFIVRQVKQQPVPTEKMATSYFKACQRNDSIQKAGPDQYIEGAATAAEEELMEVVRWKEIRD